MKWLIFLLPFALFADDLRPAQRTLDVVIIGGGISGVYTGWRLMENGKRDVHIFEGSDRIGGRIHTTHLAGMPSVPVELGALYYFPSQKKIADLINRFDLPVHNFTTQDENNFIYVRGKRFREMDESKQLPYNLPADERGKEPSDLIVHALKSIDPHLSLESWEAQKHRVLYKGRSLFDVSWQSFLLEALSPEGFQLLTDLGYVQMVADVSVATAVTYFLGGHKGEPLKVATGFNELPKRIVAEFKKVGGSVYLKHHLMSVSYEGEKDSFRYRLLFYQADGSFRAVYAKHLIFAIPPPALKMLAQQSPALKDEHFHANLDQLTAVPFTRLYLGYDYPWWKKLGVEGGFSLTTLPIRRCIYFGSEQEGIGGEEGNRRSLICASSQCLYDSFWDSFSGGKEFAPGVGEGAVWQAEKQLEILHGTTKMPHAYTASFIDWSEAPYFGAYFYWRTGARPEDLVQYFQHPFVGEPFYVIGSAFSQKQGWIEGALDSADNLLKNYFFIEPLKN
ncbi:MAG: hypothetical protein S4CHLAM81_08520 [Chlamydiales bacterium]|nr:hypothetical protein [Chlamydiales bacterium]MCH9635634.1 hypothetical protein [Chlamydiales bacterium]